MKPIIRGTGVNESERYLIKLTDKTFLRLWSYPNTYRDVTKELADLLVICGNDILIFSDKSGPIDLEVGIELGWSRWYRKAITKSLKQLKRAENWLENCPNRIFLDDKCTEPLPIDLPPSSNRKVYHIIIAGGVTELCKRFYDDESGTFPINGLVKGEGHLNIDDPTYMPLSLGDVNPLGAFTHVFDPSAFDIVMAELDTVSDLTAYLKKRETFLRSGRFGFADGEEELLAFYLQNINADGSHDFIPSDFDFPGRLIAIFSGEYHALINSDEYKSKQLANRISYVWDRLIDTFVEHIMAGTSVEILGHKPSTVLADAALRIMARENRTYRRALGEAFFATMHTAKINRHKRFFRTVLPGQSCKGRRHAYVFLVLAYPKNLYLENGYEQYRIVRSNMLHAYCLHLFDQVKNLDIVIGIGIDAFEEMTGRKGGSEDLVALERPEWTDEVKKSLTTSCKLFEFRPIEINEATHAFSI